jgi:hypothetical protein
VSHSPIQHKSSLGSRSVGVLIGSLACATIAIAGCSSSSTTEQDPNALATSLVTASWDTAVAANSEDLASMTSTAYRLQRADGTGAWQDEYLAGLEDPAAYDLTGFTISDMQARRDGDVLVATYNVDMQLTRDGKPFPQGPTPFLASYVERDGKWLLVTEANFGGD